MYVYMWIHVHVHVLTVQQDSPCGCALIRTVSLVHVYVAADQETYPGSWLYCQHSGIDCVLVGMLRCSSVLNCSC